MLEIDYTGATSGYVQLSFNGHSTEKMQWTDAELKKDVNDATGTYLQAKLEALATVGKISVSPCAVVGTKATWYIKLSNTKLLFDGLYGLYGLY
jgi:hypothetical protein